MPATTGIILAGGKSSRLGSEKALAKLGEKSLIELTVDCLSTICQAIIVVTNQNLINPIKAIQLNVKLVLDFYPGKGALGGVYTGLASTDTYYSLIVGCDMPFLNRDLLNHLIYSAPGFDAVVPEINGMIEPLHAIYSKNCLITIKQLLDQGDLRVSKLVSLVKTRYVNQSEIDKFDPEHLSFFNINTQKDLRKARSKILHNVSLNQI